MTDEHEPLQNLRLVCDQHRPSPNPVYNGMTLNWFQDQYCKLAFPQEDGDRQEYMWVKVTGLAETEGEELRGELDNDPVLATQFRCGDIVEFRRDEILQVLSENEN